MYKNDTEWKDTIDTDQYKLPTAYSSELSQFHLVTSYAGKGSVLL